MKQLTYRRLEGIYCLAIYTQENFNPPYEWNSFCFYDTINQNVLVNLAIYRNCEFSHACYHT
jgi:hypothetical protein